MTVLYIAYSCLPNKGSEEKIGWNIPLESSKDNKVFVLTKEEHRDKIEQYILEHKLQNIKFYYVDIPKIYKFFLRGMAYSGRLNIWHRRAYLVAKQISESENIDLIHQITPIEFRSIGSYGKIPNIKFVCGPIGGGEAMPQAFRQDIGNYVLLENIRSCINYLFLLKFKIKKHFRNCDYIMFANRETRDFCAGLVEDVPDELFFDNGVDLSEEFITQYNDNKQSKQRMVFLVAGRLVYRKGHSFLLNVLSRLPEDVEYECRILGAGPELTKLKAKALKYGLDQRVKFIGRIPYAEMTQEYNNADVFIMPSIRETTGSVLLEAMSKGLPVVTINKFGGPVLISERTGWLYDGSNKEEYVNNLKDILLYCIAHPEEVRNRGNAAACAAKKEIWEEKMKHYNLIYHCLCCHEGADDDTNN